MDGDSNVTSLSSIESVGAGGIHGLSMTPPQMKMHETLRGLVRKVPRSGNGAASIS